MRIVVGIEQAHPELALHLLEITPRQRAERLRVLATIGLLLARGAQSHHTARGKDLTTTGTGVASARNALKRRLLGSSQDGQGENESH